MQIRKFLARITSGATGIDSVSSKLINIVLPNLMPIIEHMFNYSLMYGAVPTTWKSAIIMPIPKIKHPISINHYRPISILPFLSKVLERIVSDQLIEYLTNNNLMDPCQFAYRQHSSTQTCIIRMLDDVRQAADNR